MLLLIQRVGYPACVLYSSAYLLHQPLFKCPAAARDHGQCFGLYRFTAGLLFLLLISYVAWGEFQTSLCLVFHSFFFFFLALPSSVQDLCSLTRD